MRCPQCQHENEAGAKFCEECAAPLARACAKCGRPLSATAKFCPECAYPTGPSAVPPLAQRFGSPESYTPKHLAEKILTSRRRTSSPLLTALAQVPDDRIRNYLVDLLDSRSIVPQMRFRQIGRIRLGLAIETTMGRGMEHGVSECRVIESCVKANANRIPLVRSFEDDPAALLEGADRYRARTERVSVATLVDCVWRDV